VWPDLCGHYLARRSTAREDGHDGIWRLAPEKKTEGSSFSRKRDEQITGRSSFREYLAPETGSVPFSGPLSAQSNSKLWFRDGMTIAAYNGEREGPDCGPLASFGKGHGLGRWTSSGGFTFRGIHFIAFHCISLHFIAFHCISLHFISPMRFRFTRGVAEMK